MNFNAEEEQKENNDNSINSKQKQSDANQSNQGSDEGDLKFVFNLNLDEASEKGSEENKDISLQEIKIEDKSKKTKQKASKNEKSQENEKQKKKSKRKGSSNSQEKKRKTKGVKSQKSQKIKQNLPPIIEENSNNPENLQSNNCSWNNLVSGFKDIQRSNEPNLHINVAENDPCKIQ